MQHVLKPALLCLLGLMLPGCIKYYELSKSEFPQSKQVKTKKHLRDTYIRDISMYKEFTTIGLLDALWLSPEVQQYYVNRHSSKCGKNDAMRNALDIQHAQDAHNYISFYVLADMRTHTNTLLSDKGSPWTFYLTINGQTIEPLKKGGIKLLDILDPEYELLFGTRVNNFKKPYLVRFPACDLDLKPYLDMNNYAMTLTIAGPHYEGETTWDSTQTETTRKNDDADFYWI